MAGRGLLVRVRVDFRQDRVNLADHLQRRTWVSPRCSAGEEGGAMWDSINMSHMRGSTARYTYPIEITIGEEASTTGDGGPGTFPAAFPTLVQWWELDGSFGRRVRALLLQIGLGVRTRAHCWRSAIVARFEGALQLGGLTWGGRVGGKISNLATQRIVGDQQDCSGPMISCARSEQ